MKRTICWYMEIREIFIENLGISAATKPLPYQHYRQKSLTRDVSSDDIFFRLGNQVNTWYPYENCKI